MQLNWISALFFITSLIFSNAYSGRDPISWQTTNQIPTMTTVGENYYIIYTFTNQIPRQLVHPINIKKDPSPAIEFAYADNCSGKLLRPQEQCTVEVYYTPLFPGKKSISLTIEGYDYNRVKLPTLITTSLGSTSGVHITATIPTPLVSPLAVGQTSAFEFQFQNTGTESATGVLLSVSSGW